jgi:hypothetical protein
LVLIFALSGAATALMLIAVLFFQGPPKDITFFLVSDTHYGLSDSVVRANRGAIRAMSSLPGTPFPEDLGGEWIRPPQGVIVLGDLVEDGGGESGEAQWRQFITDYGINGEGLVSYPVYEGFGNHDGGAEHPVRSGIRERNRRRPDTLAISANGYHYSWDWGRVHFVQLNLYPGSDGEDIINPWGKRFEGSWKYPLHSLEFLQRDLAERVGDSGRPVVLLQHYGWDEWGLGWWGEAERDAFFDAIEPYNIAAVFWGHSHAARHIPWRDIPTICVGSAQHDPDPGVVMVVRITGKDLVFAEKTSQGWGLRGRLPLKPEGTPAYINDPRIEDKPSQGR